MYEIKILDEAWMPLDESVLRGMLDMARINADHVLRQLAEGKPWEVAFVTVRKAAPDQPPSRGGYTPAGRTS